MVVNIMTKIFTEQAGRVAGDKQSDGSYPIVLITPGQGTSGYYHEQIIRDYAPGAFPKGTHVYLDHLKEGESRSPEKLLGTLVEDTTVNEDGEAVNRFKPLSKHADWVEEVKPFVGFSVSVAGEGRKGEVDGRTTLIVESLTPRITNTVDLVSYAGRGGRFLESFLDEANSLEEAQRNQADGQTGSRKENETMTVSDEQLAALTESVTALVAKLTEQAPAEPKGADEAAEERFAAIEAVRAVESADISDATKTRLMEGIKAGNYDVNEAIEAEVKLREELRAELESQILHEAGASARGNLNESADDLPEGW
jgi:hypothetical protein